MWIGVPFCAVAFLCSAVGLGIPYWAVYDHYLFGHVNYGVFQVCFDLDLVGCEFTAPTVTMIIVRVLASLGTLLVLVALILAVVKVCSRKDQQGLFKAASGLAFTSATATFIGVIVFAVAREKQTSTNGRSYGENYTFHAGFYLSIAAGVLCLITGVLLRINRGNSS